MSDNDNKDDEVSSSSEVESYVENSPKSLKRKRKYKKREKTNKNIPQIYKVPKEKFEHALMLLNSDDDLSGHPKSPHLIRIANSCTKNIVELKDNPSEFLGKGITSYTTLFQIADFYIQNNDWQSFAKIIPLFREVPHCYRPILIRNCLKALLTDPIAKQYNLLDQALDKLFDGLSEERRTILYKEIFTSPV